MIKNVVWMISIVAIGVSGCDVNQINFDDVKEPPLRSLVAFPLGETQYTLRELIAEVNDDSASVNIEEDPETTLLFIQYSDTVRYETSGDIVSVDDVVNGDTIDIAPQATVTEDTSIPIPRRTSIFEYDAEEGELIDSARYAAGELALELSSNFPYPVNYDITILNTISPAGAPVNFLGTFNIEGGDTQDLTGYRTELIPVNGANTFQVIFDGSIDLPAGTDLPGSEIRFTLTYRNQEFEILYGYFGRDTVSAGSESTDVSFFEELGEGGITFENPQINMTFINEIGVPAAMDFSTIYGVKEREDGSFDTTFLEGPVTQSLQPIRNPGPLEVGTADTSRLSINGRNSRLNDILNESPQQLVFDITAITNPQGQGVQNFYQDGMALDTYVQILLPMSIQMRNLRREISFDLPGDFEIDFADSVSIRIVTENLLPFTTTADLQFLDENDSVLYETLDHTVIATPFLNADFRAVEAEENKADIPIPAAGIQVLGQTRKVKLILFLSTPQTLNSRNIYVDLLARYSITIKTSLVGKLDVKL